MAEQKIKFKVSIKELSFEFEGSREVGQALQTGLNQSIGRLMDTQKTVMLPPNELSVLEIDPPEAHVKNAAINGTEKASKRQRRTGGPSQITLLRDLKTEGFFVEPRPMAAILERLRIKGHNVSGNSISGRLQEMTKKQELYRQSAESGYVYKETAFDESDRTQNGVS